MLGRAARAGLGEAPSTGTALPLLVTALDALAEADGAERDERLGALLWATAAWARAEDVDAESALRERTTRFIAEATSEASKDGAS